MRGFDALAPGERMYQEFRISKAAFIERAKALVA